MPPGMRRRDFVRASAGASLGVMTAGGLFKAAEAAAAPGPGAAGGPGSLAPYVGAGATAASRPFPLTQVALGPGLLKEKQDRMISFARGYDERRFLVLFNQLAGRPNPPGVNAPGGWEDGGLLSGHWTGHYMTMLGQAAAAGYTDLQTSSRGASGSSAKARTRRPTPPARQARGGRRGARRVPGRAGRPGPDRAPRLPRLQAGGHRAADRPA